MNEYDRFFFKSFVSEWSEILGVIHGHIIQIISTIIWNMLLLAIIPSYLYFKSWLIQETVPFLYFEAYLILVFLKITYDIFDWYNDVWIITDSWVVDLEWSFLNSNNVSLKFENIEGIEVEQKWLWDKVFWKWELVIHKVWEWTFTLPDAAAPYDAVNRIEEASSMHFDWDEDEDHEWYDDVMHVLSSVVKDHLDKKSWRIEWLPDYEGEFDFEELSPEYNELEELKEKVRKKEWTIDLS